MLQVCINIYIIKGQDLVCSLRQDQVHRQDRGSVDSKHQCMVDSGSLFDSGSVATKGLCLNRVNIWGGGGGLSVIEWMCGFGVGD